MLARTFSTFEHQRIPVGDSGAPGTLSTAEADCLSLIGEQRRGFCERGYRSILLSQFCGVVSVGERILEVLPKIDTQNSAETCRGILLRLLRQAEDFPLFEQLPVGQHLRHAALLEVFIAAFFDQVTLLVRGGLLRQYQAHQDDLQCVRGRIDAHRQFSTLANRSDRIACSYDDLTADNTWNRLIKRALKAVRPWITSTDINRRWIELMAVFEDVHDERLDPGTLDRLVFDRQANRYKAAIDWVRWILALLSPNVRGGQNLAPGLLFDMNKLFESAIASKLHSCARHRPGLEIYAQHAERYLATVEVAGGRNRQFFNLRPDLVAMNKGKVVAIGDTKWKKIELRSGYLAPEQADVYQMQAYAAAYQCEDLALIYPWHDGLKDARETVFHLPKIGEIEPRLSVLCVDVHEDGLSLSGSDRNSRFSEILASSSD
jgi:5-methylcytosine-specific restriction enzyme subunit McrC